MRLSEIHDIMPPKAYSRVLNRALKAVHDTIEGSDTFNEWVSVSLVARAERTLLTVTWYSTSHQGNEEAIEAFTGVLKAEGAEVPTVNQDTAVTASPNWTLKEHTLAFVWDTRYFFDKAELERGLYFGDVGKLFFDSALYGPE